MNNKTIILIGVCVVVVCATVLISIKLVGKNKSNQSGWSITPYSTDAMNSLVGSFQAGAGEGGAGQSAW